MLLFKSFPSIWCRGWEYVPILLVCIIKGKKKTKPKPNQLTLLNEGLVLYLTVLRLVFSFLLLPKIKGQTTSVSSAKVKAETFSDVWSAIHWMFASKPQLHVWTVRHPSPTSLLRRAWIVSFSLPLTGQPHTSISCTTTSTHRTSNCNSVVHCTVARHNVPAGFPPPRCGGCRPPQPAGTAGVS